ncbi:hypothetical protein HYH03_016566 [Edaphochlamys debaryana]|uniref:cyclin-dependent kinase n=1 Tax=Edaphochlamys debaryana TaxID=47281 RepID=A0A835XK18_9CHLO|nr:hypothetical protein HYH03_016566 [Edaphochlamys debaryana]|eukprot:KAG2484612.1 hypothetical protein HYH03_016566 [Edaphochlamys debaryana]
MAADPQIPHQVAEDYEFLESLGRGAYGSVWRCIQRHTGADVAVKGFRRTAGDPDELLRLALREVRLLRSLDHPAVIRLVEAFKGRSGRVFMVFPYVGPSAFQVLEAHPRGLPPRTLLLVAWQLAQVLAYLHGRKVVHRDLKPANVLMGEGGVARLCDFGFARSTACGPRDDQTLTPYTVTRWYRPPEVLLGCPYGPAADVWSLGCTLAELATGKPLFPGTSSADQLALIRECLVLRGQAAGGEGLRARLPHLEAALFTLIEACVSMDPMQRPTAEELLRMTYLSGVRAVLKGTALAAEYDEYYERRRSRHEAHQHHAAEQALAADDALTATQLLMRKAYMPDPISDPDQDPSGQDCGFQLSQQEGHDGPKQPSARLFVFPEGGPDANAGPALGSGAQAASLSACGSASVPLASASASVPFTSAVASTPFTSAVASAPFASATTAAPLASAAASAFASAALGGAPFYGSSSDLVAMGSSARLGSAPQLKSHAMRLCLDTSQGSACGQHGTDRPQDPAAAMAAGASRAAAAANRFRLGEERKRAASDHPPGGKDSPGTVTDAGEWLRDSAHCRPTTTEPSDGRGCFSHDARGAGTYSSSAVVAAVAAAGLGQRSTSAQQNLHLAASPGGGGGGNSGQGRSPSLPQPVSVPRALGAAAWDRAANSNSGHVTGPSQLPGLRATAAPAPKNGSGWRTAADRAAAAAGRPPPSSSSRRRSVAEVSASHMNLGARSHSVDAGASDSLWGRVGSMLLAAAGGKRLPSAAAGTVGPFRPSASAVRSPLSRPSPVSAVQSSIQATLMSPRPTAPLNKDTRNTSLSGVPECRTPSYAQPSDPLCSDTLPRVRHSRPPSVSLAESLGGTVSAVGGHLSRLGLSPGPSPSPAAGSALVDVPGSAGPEFLRAHAFIDLGGDITTTLIGTTDEPLRQGDVFWSGLDWQPSLQARPANPLAAAAPQAPPYSASAARLALRAGASSGRRRALRSSSSARAPRLAHEGGGGGGGGVLGGANNGGVGGLAQLALVEVDEEASSPYSSSRAAGRGDSLGGLPAPAEGLTATPPPLHLGHGGASGGNLSDRVLVALQAMGMRMGSVAGEASPRSSGQLPTLGSALPAAGPSGAWANPAPPPPPSAAAASRPAAAVPPPPARRAGLRSPVTRFGSTSGDGTDQGAVPVAVAAAATATTTVGTPARAAVPTPAQAVPVAGAGAGAQAAEEKAARTQARGSGLPSGAEMKAAGVNEQKSQGLMKRFVKAVKRTFVRAADT